MQSRRSVSPEELVELAYRRLNLSRSAWRIECVLFSNPIMLRTTHVRTRRHTDRSATYRTRAERETTFLAAVADSVAELRRDLDDCPPGFSAAIANAGGVGVKGD